MKRYSPHDYQDIWRINGKNYFSSAVIRRGRIGFGDRKKIRGVEDVNNTATVYSFFKNTI